MSHTIRSEYSAQPQRAQSPDWRCLLTRRDVRRVAARNARATAVSSRHHQGAAVLSHLIVAACAAVAIGAAVWLTFAPVIGAISTLTL